MLLHKKKCLIQLTKKLNKNWSEHKKNCLNCIVILRNISEEQTTVVLYMKFTAAI